MRRSSRRDFETRSFISRSVTRQPPGSHLQSNGRRRNFPARTVSLLAHYAACVVGSETDFQLSVQDRPPPAASWTSSPSLPSYRGFPGALPFHHVMVHFQHRDFGEALPGHALTPAQTPGIVATDSWWINGRNRGLLSLRVVDAGEFENPAIARRRGRGHSRLLRESAADNTSRIAVLDTARTTMEAAQADPGTTRRVSELVRDYRKRLTEIVEQARMPQDLPSALEALKTIPLGTTSGPKKPALVAAFKPLGYSCRGGSGVFTLRRTSRANLSIEVALDVGSWSTASPPSTKSMAWDLRDYPFHRVATPSGPLNIRSRRSPLEQHRCKSSSPGDRTRSHFPAGDRVRLRRGAGMVPRARTLRLPKEFLDQPVVTFSDVAVLINRTQAALRGSSSSSDRSTTRGRRRSR